MDTSSFQFALGQRVIWVRVPTRVWIIHVRMLLDDAQGTAVQYGLRPAGLPGVRHERWAREADLAPYPRPPQAGA
jgi:hypothetical protein